MPLDSRERAYIYRSLSDENRTGFDLLTSGRDGKAGGEDKDADITNWQ